MKMKIKERKDIKGEYKTQVSLYKIIWIPIKRKTYNFYIGRPWRFHSKLHSFWEKISHSSFGLGFYYFEADASLAHTLQYKKRHVSIQFLWWDLNWWIRWNIYSTKEELEKWLKHKN